MNRIVLELDKKLNDGELLIYKDGTVKSTNIHKLLPAYLNALECIEQLVKRVDALELQVKELRGED